MLYDWSVLTCIRIINSLKRCWDQEIVTLILSLSYLWSLRPFFGLFFREKNCLQGPCSPRYHRVGRPVKVDPRIQVQRIVCVKAADAGTCSFLTWWGYNKDLLVILQEYNQREILRTFTLGEPHHRIISVHWHTYFHASLDFVTTAYVIQMYHRIKLQIQFLF